MKSACLRDERVVGFREVLSEQVLLGALQRGVGRQRGS